MKNHHSVLSIFIFLCITACRNEPKKNTVEAEAEKTIVEKIALANGLENFDNIKELKYTFNVKVNDTLRTSRAWTWNPNSNTVSLTTKDSTVTYDHKSEAAQHEWVDQRFINDQYWLLFPFHLAWDELDHEHQQSATAPISGKTFQKLTVTYPSDKGYTPGDVYEVFFDDSLMIREWIYRSGGNIENAFPATWEDYKDFEGIKIATRHTNKDESFVLFFTNVEIRD